MRNGDDGTGEIMQKFLQPSDRFSIEMVCWLIKQQHIRSAQQKLTQRHPTLFPAG